MRAVAEQLTPVTLELGGKGANIVFPDADLGWCAKAICFGIYMNAGQMCWAGSRLIVHQDVAEDLVDRIAAYVGGWTIGPGMSEGVRMGSLVHKDHRAEVLGRLWSAAWPTVGVFTLVGQPWAGTWNKERSWRRRSSRTSAPATRSSGRNCSDLCSP